MARTKQVARSSQQTYEQAMAAYVQYRANTRRDNRVTKTFADWKQTDEGAMYRDHGPKKVFKAKVAGVHIVPPSTSPATAASASTHKRPASRSPSPLPSSAAHPQPTPSPLLYSSSSPSSSSSSSFAAFPVTDHLFHALTTAAAVAIPPSFASPSTSTSTFPASSPPTPRVHHTTN